jgi:carbon storage regulator
MLMMSRRQGEVILIGDEIEIVIAHIGRSRVKVGIRAPRTTPVVARELKLVQEENVVAAAPAADRASRLLELWRGRSPASETPER